MFDQQLIQITELKNQLQEQSQPKEVLINDVCKVSTCDISCQFNVYTEEKSVETSCILLDDHI